MTTHFGAWDTVERKTQVTTAYHDVASVQLETPFTSVLWLHVRAIE